MDGSLLFTYQSKQEITPMNISNEDDTGVVYRKSLGHYSVRAHGNEIDCEVSSRLHKELIYPTSGAHRRVRAVKELDHADPVAIGDQVRYTDAGPGRGLITEVLPRKSKLSRPQPVPGARVFEQVIVANSDQVLPVFAAFSPTPKWGLLDRYLVTAEAAGLPARIVITKMDLASENETLETDLEVYRRIGYPIHLVCSNTGQGLDELKDALRGKLSVLVGKSGVGKTSLMNALQPGLGLRVKEVSKGDIGKGRHTTSHLQMFDLDFSGQLVDTPGMREFGLWDVAPEDLANYFPEIAPYVGSCKFGLDCGHDTEPGCAVRKAVMDERVSPYRYQSYLRMRGEL
jgi:ribosome biogenesis GTPase